MLKKIIILTIALLIFFSFLFYSQLYAPLSMSQETKTFVIKTGEGLGFIANNLKAQNLIKTRLFFELYVYLQKGESSLKAGEYNLSPSMSISQIAQKLLQGETTETKITIIEGWNLKNVAVYLEEQSICQKEAFLETVNHPENFVATFDFLKDKPIDMSLEGYLFPDTYNIKTSASPKTITATILNNFDKKLTPVLREEIFKQKKTIFEIITMASLLEKEVKTKEDKEIVSGILWKRLKTGMPLQVDATIGYITGKSTIEISIDELQIDSPYNTYKYAGLPLGPICNPGLESISAAIYPKESNFWYYLSTPKGETIFSRNLAEHNRAKAKYLK